MSVDDGIRASEEALRWQASRLLDERNALRKMLEVVVQELEYEIKCRYGEPVHLALQPKHDLDMALVHDARKLLKSMWEESDE